MVNCLDSTVETFIARNKRIIIQYQSVDGKKNTKHISIPKATILLDTIKVYYKTGWSLRLYLKSIYSPDPYIINVLLMT